MQCNLSSIESDIKLWPASEVIVVKWPILCRVGCKTLTNQSICNGVSDVDHCDGAQCVFVCINCQLPAATTQQYNQAVRRLDPADKSHCWFHPDDMSRDVGLSSLSHPPPTDIRQPSFIPTTPRASRPRPLQSDLKYLATAAGPLSNEMMYPEIHSVPHGGTTRASFRRTRHGSIGTVDRDLYRGPAAAVSTPAAGSLRRTSNDIGRPRQTTFGTLRAGLPPGDYTRKHEVPLPEWTAASELEYRVWRTVACACKHETRSHTEDAQRVYTTLF